MYVIDIDIEMSDSAAPICDTHNFSNIPMAHLYLETLWQDEIITKDTYETCVKTITELHQREHSTISLILNRKGIPSCYGRITIYNISELASPLFYNGDAKFDNRKEYRLLIEKLTQDYITSIMRLAVTSELGNDTDCSAIPEIITDNGLVDSIQNLVLHETADTFGCYYPTF